MNILGRLLYYFRNSRKVDNKCDFSKPGVSKLGVFSNLDCNGARDAIERHANKIDRDRENVERVVRENANEVGWLSANINWIFIQEVGQYLSPKGGFQLRIK